MRHPSKPGYHSLGALNRAIRREIKLSFPDKLTLAGQRPDSWPDGGTPEHERLIRQIKSGLAFYCMEDFLWPNGREEEPIEIWVGHMLRNSARYPRDTKAYLHKLGGQEHPGLTDVLWTPRRPDVQPVAIRTYADASCYRRAGELIERRHFPLLTSQWRVREHLLERALVPSEFHRKFRFKELYYHGDYPSRIAECSAPEIIFVLGAGRDPNDETRYGLYAPPDAKLKRAHARQVRRLAEQWRSRGDNSNKAPSYNWVRDNLIDWLPGEEDVSGFVNDDFAKSYLKHLAREI